MLEPGARDAELLADPDRRQPVGAIGRDVPPCELVGLGTADPHDRCSLLHREEVRPPLTLDAGRCCHLNPRQTLGSDRCPTSGTPTKRARQRALAMNLPIPTEPSGHRAQHSADKFTNDLVAHVYEPARNDTTRHGAWARLRPRQGVDARQQVAQCDVARANDAKVPAIRPFRWLGPHALGTRRSRRSVSRRTLGRWTGSP